MLQDGAQADAAEPVDTPAAFLYMRVAAKRYLLEPDTFQKRAGLDLMLADNTPERLALVQSGLQQIIAWRGFHPDKPFRGLGVGGLYALLWLLHFRVLRQAARPVDPSCFLDVMDVEHGELGLQTTLYNLAPRAPATAELERG